MAKEKVWADFFNFHQSRYYLQGRCNKLITKKWQNAVVYKWDGISLANELWAPGIVSYATLWKPLSLTAAKQIGRAEERDTIKLLEASQIRQPTSLQVVCYYATAVYFDRKGRTIADTPTQSMIIRYVKNYRQSSSSTTVPTDQRAETFSSTLKPLI